jgi:DNA-binding transcriptional regulator of glucitol operon
LLHPKWWLLHLPVIAACVVMIFLGRWQWHTAGERHGDVRNYAYAVQWWLFAVFTVVMWVRVMVDYLRPRAAEGEPISAPAASPATASTAVPQSTLAQSRPVAGSAGFSDVSAASSVSAAPSEATQAMPDEERYLRYMPPEIEPDDDDEERARFNAYLAGLDATQGKDRR